MPERHESTDFKFSLNYDPTKVSIKNKNEGCIIVDPNGTISKPDDPCVLIVTDVKPESSLDFLKDVLNDMGEELEEVHLPYIIKHNFIMKQALDIDEFLSFGAKVVRYNPSGVTITDAQIIEKRRNDVEVSKHRQRIETERRRLEDEEVSTIEMENRRRKSRREFRKAKKAKEALSKPSWETDLDGSRFEEIE